MPKLKLPTTTRGIFFVVTCVFGSLCLLSYGLPWLWQIIKPLRDRLDAFNQDPTVMFWGTVLLIVFAFLWIIATIWLGSVFNPRPSRYESLRDRLERRRVPR